MINGQEMPSARSITPVVTETTPHTLNFADFVFAQQHIVLDKLLEFGE
jgi:hypothetical protein